MTISLAIFSLIDVGPRWNSFFLPGLHSGLLNGVVFLAFASLVLEVAPLCQNLHGLNVFNGCQLLPIIFVAAKRVKVQLLSETLVLILHDLQDEVDLLAVEHLLVVHACNRVEDGPHDLRVVHSAEVVANVQTEDDLVQLSLFNSDALVPQWWRQFAQEVRQSDGTHVQFTHWVVLGPCVLEGLDVLFLKGQDIVLILRLLVLIETLTDNGDEDIHEDKEGNQLECRPEEGGKQSLAQVAIMHDTIPRLTGGGTEQSHERDVERLEVDVVVHEVTVWHFTEQTHTCHTEGKQDQSQQSSSVEDVTHGHYQCLEQLSKTLGGLDHSEETGHSHDTQGSDIEVQGLE